MNKILLLYPKSFQSYSKFYRKVNNIISRLEQVSLVYPNDANGFIEKLSENNSLVSDTIMLSNWSNEDITHAIIFDDGEEFTKETENIKTRDIPLRVINILITRVINIKIEKNYQSHKSTSTYEYIGRGSYWGNPYSIYEVEDLEDNESPRENVIRKFKYDFEYNCLLNRDINQVHKLAGKRLGCFCKPESCHGDVIANFLNSLDDEK